MATLLELEITEKATRLLSKGHCWIFSNEFTQKIRDLTPGLWVNFKHRGQDLGTGYVNPHSLIAGRLVTRGELLNSSEEIVAHLKLLLEKSFERRKKLMSVGACRLVFSESDFLPGLIIDQFSNQVVMQINTAGMETVKNDLVRLIPEVYSKVFAQKCEALVVRADANVRTLEGLPSYNEVILGTEEHLRNTSFSENQINFCADLFEGQKTGFFLDQRENRQFLREYLKQKPNSKVLDLCCYTGGWGLNTMASGAHCTFVDQSKPAIELVKKAVTLNSFDEKMATYVVDDVFDYLEKNREQYDVVVCDPPAFVKSKKNLPQAVKAYEKLNRLAVKHLKAGGLLLSCSCSYHVSKQEFEDIVRFAFERERLPGHVVYQSCQPEDHPQLISMPETSYLKCLGVRAL